MKKENQNILFFGGIGVIAVILIYLVIKNNKRKSDKPTETNTTTTTTGITATNTNTQTSNEIDTSKMLEIGSEGAEVQGLQRILNYKNNAELLEDGVFGELTETALRNATGANKTTLAQMHSFYDEQGSSGNGTGTDYVDMADDTWWGWVTGGTGTAIGWIF